MNHSRPEQDKTEFGFYQKKFIFLLSWKVEKIFVLFQRGIGKSLFLNLFVKY